MERPCAGDREVVLVFLVHVDAVDDFRVGHCLQVVDGYGDAVDAVEVAVAFVGVAGSVGFAYCINRC